MTVDGKRPMSLSSEAGLAGFPPSVLLEREPELEILGTLVSEAAAGEARVVVVEGAAGIGKTRLLAETCRLTREAGIPVLRARGGELEREFAFGVVRQLFEPTIVDRGQSAFAGPAAATRELFELGSWTAAAEFDDRSFALLHGLYWLTVGLADESPLAIVIDDLHWCDPASLRFLAYLVRRLEGLAVLVVFSVRSGERADSPAIEEIRSDPLSVLIRPTPLSVDATARLVADRLGDGADPAFAGACRDATTGNPLLLHELLKTLAIEGVRPDAGHVAQVSVLGVAASRAVLARLARLSPTTVLMARATAVLGGDAELSIVAALAGVELEQAARGVAELERSEVLDGQSAPRFVHPLVGEAVYRDMPGAERALWHERAAGLLADSGDLERVAAHLLLSPARGRQQVVRALVSAAQTSVRQGSCESAVTYLKRALREPPAAGERPGVLLALGRAETLTHDLSAVEHLTQAYDLLTDPWMRAAAAHTLSRVLLRIGDPRAARVARAAAAELPPELEDARRQLEALELMALLVIGGSGDREALVRLKRHRRTPVGPGLGAKMLATIAAQAWTHSGGTSDECAQLALEALAGGEMVAADAGPLTATPIQILALTDRPEALIASRRALARARQAGSLFDLTSAGLWGSYVLYRRGELADAEELLRSAYEEAGLQGLPGPGKLYCNAVLSAVLRERGKLDEARRVLERSHDRGDDGEATRYWVHSQLELLVAEGRMFEAVALSEAFETRFSTAADAVDTPWRSATAVALDRLGSEQDAVRLARADLEVARRWGAPGAVSRALRTLGTIEGKDGIELVEQAVRISAATPARLEHAKALAAFGVALRRSGRRAAARDPLRQAFELAELLGADSLAERVGSELHATGGRLGRTAPRGVAALTPSERRVAALAATGHTNRQIAQELFVTLKTVEMHLSRSYAKLQIASRHQLAAHAAELQTITTGEPAVPA